MNKISVMIKRLREERGLSQAGLAERSGLSLALVRDIEQGQVPSNRSRRLIAWALDLSLHDLGGFGPGYQSDEERAEQGRFRSQFDGIFEGLIESARGKGLSHDEVEILTDKENWIGFLEVLWIMKKYGVFPKV